MMSGRLVDPVAIAENSKAIQQLTGDVALLNAEYGKTSKLKTYHVEATKNLEGLADEAKGAQQDIISAEVTKRETDMLIEQMGMKAANEKALGGTPTSLVDAATALRAAQEAYNKATASMDAEGGAITGQRFNLGATITREEDMRLKGEQALLDARRDNETAILDLKKKNAAEMMLVSDEELRKELQHKQEIAAEDLKARLKVNEDALKATQENDRRVEALRQDRLTQSLQARQRLEQSQYRASSRQQQLLFSLMSQSQMFVGEAMGGAGGQRMAAEGNLQQTLLEAQAQRAALNFNFGQTLGTQARAHAKDTPGGTDATSLAMMRGMIEDPAKFKALGDRVADGTAKTWESALFNAYAEFADNMEELRHRLESDSIKIKLDIAKASFDAWKENVREELSGALFDNPFFKEGMENALKKARPQVNWFLMGGIQQPTTPTPTPTAPPSGGSAYPSGPAPAGTVGYGGRSSAVGGMRVNPNTNKVEQSYTVMIDGVPATKFADGTIIDRFGGRVKSKVQGTKLVDMSPGGMYPEIGMGANHGYGPFDSPLASRAIGFDTGDYPSHVGFAPGYDVPAPSGVLPSLGKGELDIYIHADGSITSKASGDMERIALKVYDAKTRAVKGGMAGKVG